MLEGLEVVVLFLGQGLQWHDVEGSAVGQDLLEHPQDGDQGLARGGGDGQHQVLAHEGVLEGVRLGWIELGDALGKEFVPDLVRYVQVLHHVRGFPARLRHQERIKAGRV